MKRLLLNSTALVAIAAGSGAQAADLPPRMPVKAPIAYRAYNWSGFYAGVLGGYGWRDPSIAFTGNGAAEATYFAPGFIPRSVSVNPHGWLGGAQAGYNSQVGNAIFGFETDLSYGSIRGDGTAPGAPLTTNIFFAGKPPVTTVTAYQFAIAAAQKLDWLGTVRGRLGYTPFDRFLIFATGGFAYGHASLSANVLNVSATQTTTPPGTTISLPACILVCATGSTSQWLPGWTLGFGGEYASNSFWTAKVEYLYYDLGHLSVSFSDPRFAAFIFNASAEYKGHIVRAVWSVKLN
jgi:outer membrane immunogenic protein